MRALTVGNMYPPHHLGGYELVWQGAVGHLRAAGHEVSVLTTDHRSHGVEALDPPWVHRDLLWWWRDHDFPRCGLRERRRRERVNAAVLAERLADDRPDVVLWGAMGGMTLSLIERVRRAGLPAVGIVHDDWMLYGPRVDQGITRIRPDLSAAARWLFVSEHTRRRALERVPLACTGVLPSGIDERHLLPLGPARPWRGELLCVGRLDERKGLGDAVAALGELPCARLTIVGPGDTTPLRERAERLGVADRVRFAGPHAEVAPFYDRADAVLFPVVWEEPWGLVPLEAMGHGVPVVATGRGGSGEYLRDGENALLHAPADPVALAAAVRRLAGDDALRERLRSAGRATAEHHVAPAFNRGVERALLEAITGGRMPQT